MALMVGSLYDALKEAGVSDDKAKKAAEEVAAYDNALNGLDRKVTVLDGRMNTLQWMVGFNLALTTAVLFRLFS